MGINIWLPILVNVLILGIMVAGAFVGRKNSFLHELIKLVTLCVSGVGLYFLNPIVANAVAQISFIKTLLLNNYVTIEIIKSFTLLVMFIVVYLIISLILHIIKKVKAKKVVGVRTAKPAKIYGLTKRETRKLRKENKRLVKSQKKEEKKAIQASRSIKDKVFAVIFGILVAVVIAFVVTLPMKAVFNHIASIQPSIVEIVKGYEYTPFGQLDKVTDIVNKVINR